MEGEEWIISMFVNMSKIALIIVYNHRYDKNIDIIERLYKNRFTDIFHLMPFYDGDKENVIPVYENSHYFQGYIAQGLKSYFNEKYEHYFFVADDMIINPIINELNYKDIFKLDEETDFIQRLSSLSPSWDWNRNVFGYNIKVEGIELGNLLPSYDVALAKLNSFGIKQEWIKANEIYKKKRDKISMILKLKFLKQYKTKYPFVRSYSDIAIVSKYSIKRFCHYCGIFSATHLFVECALPTSLLLACKKIICEKDLTLNGKALWTKKDYEILDKYNFNLKKLLDEFPKELIYLHPIKLSKWDIKGI